MVDIKQVAKRVIVEEANTIANLEHFIDDDFVKVVELILHTKGRVVVSGVGKSAIVAQKLVATLNSTGTPALFMHAADAVHGDLGMICPDDVVICLPNSGNTPEIKSLIPFPNCIGDPIIISFLSKIIVFLLFLLSEFKLVIISTISSFVVVSDKII